jgi:hypothetical protein
MGKLKTLKASTLIEVIVAMVILLIIYSMVIITFLNFSGENNISNKSRALILLENVSNTTKSTFCFIDKEFSFENIDVKQTILPYKGNDNLRTLKLEAISNSGKTILSKNEIIAIPGAYANK